MFSSTCFAFCPLRWRLPENFKFTKQSFKLVEIGSDHHKQGRHTTMGLPFGKAGLKLAGPSNPPISASWVAGNPSTYHCALVSMLILRHYLAAAMSCNLCWPKLMTRFTSLPGDSIVFWLAKCYRKLADNKLLLVYTLTYKHLILLFTCVSILHQRSACQPPGET